MANAGRILIIPRGDYDANTEYEMLDLVFSGGASWVAKEDVVGIEPTEDNADYWMKMCESVDLTDVENRLKTLEDAEIDLSGYLQLSGGTMTGDLKITKSKPRVQMQNTDNSRYAIVESSSEGFTSLGNWKASNDQTNLQLRQPSDGLEEAAVLTVNGTGRYRLFGEHNIELAKSLLGASNLQIATGSYTGTGYAGSDSPNSITFDFEPKVVLLENGGNVYGCPIIWHKGVTLLTLALNGSSSSKQLVFEQTEKTLKWYYPVTEASSQLNTQGTVYHWVAIG